MTVVQATWRGTGWAVGGVVLATFLGACSSKERAFDAGEMAGGSGGQSAPSDGGDGTGPGSAGSSTGGTLGGGGAANTGAGPADGGEPGGPDTIAPTVLDVSPSDGETGVRSNAKLVVTFSEPMNKLATQGAYQSPTNGLTAGAVTFSWNAAGTELTITPNAGLEYAEGGDPASVAAKAYEFFVSTAAEDRAGNSLQEELHASFSTLRRITQTLQATDVTLTGGYLVQGSGGAQTNFIWVGSIEATETYRGLVTFELEPLAEGIEELETASVRLFQKSQTSTDRTPYQALGDLQLMSITFSARDRAAFETMDSAPVIGTFGTAAAMGYKSVLVTSTLAADYAARARSQYGLRFETNLNTDLHHDYVAFGSATDPDPPELEATYLVP